LSYNVLALLTNIGKHYIAESLTTGRPVHVKYFSIGKLGHDPDDPKTALAPDPAIEEPNGVVFGPKAVSSYYLLDRYTPVWVCTIERGDLIAETSSIFLLADVEGEGPYGYPYPDQNVSIVLGVANYPLKVIVDNDRVEFHVALAM